ncbi:hypothetical protein [Dysgonomonas sp. 520]|uniref:hypothetical protein n=1 Tax=Dysgonomonas sp. 520 TaxID=2302931 RepID=UPI0013D5BA16|nr:hypothetical protein [Dysgonomonas sp. 520]NDW11006.1 hypothetical protein [Dysgonomonas sp. 520]
MRHYITRLSLLLLFLPGLAGVKVFAQQVNLEDVANITKNKPFTFNGGISAGTVIYGGTPQPGRQDWTYYLNGNLNVNVYGQINIPISINLTNLGSDLSYPSLPNRLSFHPSYKWATAHIGDVSMTFSPYTLNGHQFTGAGVDLTPGKFRISAMGGRLLRKVDYDPDNANIMPNYSRYGYGVKAEYDTEKYAVGLTYFGAKDNKVDTERITFDSLGIQPMQNSVIGFNTRISLVKNLTLIAEYAVSYLTRDAYAPKDGNGIVNDILNKRTSTNTYHAFNARINYQFLKNTIGIGYERIDPDYQTLGAYYFNNDYENITLNYARPFLKDDKATVAVSFGIQRDDLNNSKEESTDRYVGSVNLNYAPNENLQFSANYSTFQSHRNIKSQFDYINETSPYQNLDTLNFTQLSQNLDGSMMFTFKKTEKQNQRINLNMSYQESADRQGGISTPGNVSRFVNSALGYGISFIPQAININSSFNASYNYGGGVESYTLGPMIGVSANLLKKTLMTGFSTSYNMNINDGDIQAKVLNLRLNASYRILKKHNLNASFVWQNRNITNKKKTDLTTTSLSYAYSF